jgi:hypothetical protein
MGTLGTFTFGVRLEDNGLTQDYFFDVTVNKDNAPSIAGLVEQTVIAGDSLSYTLPTITDPES